VNDYFEEDGSDFLLTDQEAMKTWKNMTTYLLYLLLMVVVIVTAAHGIMVVLHVSSESFSAGSGLFGAFLNVIRISFPVTVELAAIVAGLGFIASYWRGSQKTIAFGIELTWLIFAAANMITMFAIERGLTLESWQVNWIGYGLPVAALVAGSLTYMLKRSDPDHKRRDEAASAKEKAAMLRFTARREVALSPQMRAIERQKAWVDHVNFLRMSGYSDEQVRFIMADTPELLVDGDADGVPDLLEGTRPQRRRAAPPRKKSLWERLTQRGDDDEEPVVIPGQPAGNLDIATEVIGADESVPQPHYQRQPRTQAVPRNGQNGQGADFP